MTHQPQKCAYCGKEKPLSEMSVCMVPGPLHRYVCDSVCMKKLYDPKLKNDTAEVVACIMAFPVS